MNRPSRVRVAAFSLFSFLLLLSPIVAAQAPATQRAPLRVVSAGPTGEIRKADEGNEIRVVFSEPMVPLGRISQKLKPAFFHITPDVPGVFRWSGTTILILTPARRLPLATRYDVTIDAAAAAISGRTLAAPYTFSFTTPPALLVETEWYRPDGRADAAPVIVLRFNQPVKPEDVAAHARAAFQSHSFTPPVIPQAVQARLRTLDPSALQAFSEKVERARVVASATGPVSLALAKDWDKKR
ncbi:MAG TPA: Ig-like domain-containing protein, partial [Vicinamibacterales bacterium]|nr:Ig-like domain-containing protein [Vicinamibacterales bacterium]